MALSLRTQTTCTKHVYKVLLCSEEFCIFDISGNFARVCNWVIFGNSAGNFLLRPKRQQSTWGNGICSESTTQRRRSASRNRKRLKYELYSMTKFLTDTYKKVLQQMQTNNMQITHVCKTLPVIICDLTGHFRWTAPSAPYQPVWPTAFREAKQWYAGLLLDRKSGEPNNGERKEAAKNFNQPICVMYYSYIFTPHQIDKSNLLLGCNVASASNLTCHIICKLNPRTSFTTLILGYDYCMGRPIRWRCSFRPLCWLGWSTYRFWDIKT